MFSFGAMGYLAVIQGQDMRPSSRSCLKHIQEAESLPALFHTSQRFKVPSNHDTPILPSHDTLWTERHPSIIVPTVILQAMILQTLQATTQSMEARCLSVMFLGKPFKDTERQPHAYSASNTSAWVHVPKFRSFLVICPLKSLTFWSRSRFFHRSTLFPSIVSSITWFPFWSR